MNRHKQNLYFIPSIAVYPKWFTRKIKPVSIFTNYNVTDSSNTFSYKLAVKFLPQRGQQDPGGIIGSPVTQFTSGH